tara:strand:+ start:545 stop:934 length:390 start_codon:yes stop_codon:yes gene_type:complete
MTTTDLKHTVLCIPSLDMEARLIPNDQNLFDCGYANGYVGVQKGHPLYGIDYNQLFEKVSVHGGLTFSGHIKSFSSDVNNPNWLDEGFWWIGFDTKHTGDTLKAEDKDYCLEELVSLACQLSTFTKTKY